MHACPIEGSISCARATPFVVAGNGRAELPATASTSATHILRARREEPPKPIWTSWPTYFVAETSQHGPEVSHFLLWYIVYEMVWFGALNGILLSGSRYKTVVVLRPPPF